MARVAPSRRRALFALFPFLVVSFDPETTGRNAV